MAEKFAEKLQEIEDGVVGTYKKIEDSVVGSYKKIENGAIEGFQKVSDGFIDKFLTKEGETVEEAKERMEKNLEASKNIGKR